MIPILYDKTETAYTSNGLCRLRDCISCEVTEERNGIYECDFTYPVDGANYEQIVCGRTIAVTHDDTGDVQLFDIVSYSKPIDGIVEFHAVHISYRLREIPIYLTGWTPIVTLSEAIYMLNRSNTPFTFETDFEASGYCSALGEVPYSMRQVLGGVEGSILDAFGGEYVFDRFKVKLLKNRGTLRDFSIRYGVNMVDYLEELDCSSIFNKCIPYWADQEKTIVANVVSLGVPTILGRDVCVPLDLTDKFENSPTRAQLEAKALSYMQTNNTNMPSQNIKVDFVRLQDLGYDEFNGLLKCGLCDTITIVFPEYGMNQFKIVRTVWDVLEGRYKEMELGDLQTSLTEALGITSGGEQKGVEIVTETHEIIEDGTKTITTYYGASLTLTKSGYMALGIVGHDITNTNRKWMHLSSCYLGEISEGTATVHYFLANTGTSTSWAGAFSVDVLWLKI